MSIDDSKPQGLRDNARMRSASIAAALPWLEATLAYSARGTKLFAPDVASCGLYRLAISPQY